MSQVYDCFSFLNELDLLEIRLNILDPFVDKFIITEALETHSGKSKSANLLLNMSRFEKFKDKIIYNLIDKFPKNLDAFHKHRFQVDYPLELLKTLDNNTLIITGDIDEIPNEKYLTNALKQAENNKLIIFEQKMCYYYLNMQTQDLHSVYQEKENWLGTRICKKIFFHDRTIDDLRHKNFCENAIILKEGGWHFSHQGGIEKILEKIEASAHQEYNNNYIKNNLKNIIDAKADIYFRNANFFKVPLENYPEYILKNKEKYRHMIKE